MIDYAKEIKQFGNPFATRDAIRIAIAAIRADNAKQYRKYYGAMAERLCSERIVDKTQRSARVEKILFDYDKRKNK